MEQMEQAEKKSIIGYDETLDARGLNCPLPILKTKVLLNKMQGGQVIRVESTDPHSVIDFEAYCARTKHELIDTTEEEGIYTFYIRRAENPDKF